MATANKTRGELTLSLEGVDYILRPSYEAILAFEEQTGTGIRRLADSAAKGDLTSKEVAIIATECMRAQGRAVDDKMMAAFNINRVHQLLMEADGGFVEVMLGLSVMLILATTGGYTSQGEIKAPVAKKKATPTGA